MDQLSYSHTIEGYTATETNFTHPGCHEIHKNSQEKRQVAKVYVQHNSVIIFKQAKLDYLVYV